MVCPLSSESCPVTLTTLTQTQPIHSTSQTSPQSSGQRSTPPAQMKRKRCALDSTDNHTADRPSSPPCQGSSPKRTRLAFDTPSKKTVTFHPDTIDNWHWADRGLGERADRTPTPFPQNADERPSLEEEDGFDQIALLDCELSCKASRDRGSPPPSFELDEASIPHPDTSEERPKSPDPQESSSIPSIFFNPPPPVLLKQTPAGPPAPPTVIPSLQDIAFLRSVITHQLDSDGRTALEQLLKCWRRFDWQCGYRAAMSKNLRSGSNGTAERTVTPERTGKRS